MSVDHNGPQLMFAVGGDTRRYSALFGVERTSNTLEHGVGTMLVRLQEPVKVAIHFLTCSSAYSRILQMITNESLRLECAHKLHNCINMALTVMVLTL